jgi:hypothetical protein
VISLTLLAACSMASGLLARSLARTTTPHSTRYSPRCWSRCHRPCCATAFSSTRRPSDSSWPAPWFSGS